MPHTSSTVCQKPGVAFVLGVSAIIEDQFAPTKYGEFYKQCKLDDPLGKVPKERLENEMLCVLMCCCEEFPGQGNQKDVYQGCVKDILDEVNELKKGSKELPKSRFVAEPTLNVDLKEVGRGRMNPDGPKRQVGQKLVRPDVGILKHVPSASLEGSRTIIMNNFERFIEMKFSTEPLNPSKHREQINVYLNFGKNITFMTTNFGVKELPKDRFNIWCCNCIDKKRKELLQPGEVYSAQEELEHKQEMFWKGVNAITLGIPGLAGARVLKGLGSGKILIPTGI